MLVKAKWNVSDANGWHKAGEVFRTESDLGDAVEVLDVPKKPAEEAPAQAVPVKEEPLKEETPKAKPASRRKTAK